MNGTLCEIRIFAGDYAPRNWAFCDGQLLAINSNLALFGFLGAKYGGDGQTNFALPDLRGRVAVGTGQGIGVGSVLLTNYTLGKTGGVESIILSELNLPSHSHPLSGTVSMPCLAAAGTNDTATNRYPAMHAGKNMYATAHNNVTMAAMNYNLDVANGGLSNPDPVSTIQPVLGINYIICIAGLVPERS